MGKKTKKRKMCFNVLLDTFRRVHMLFHSNGQNKFIFWPTERIMPNVWACINTHLYKSMYNFYSLNLDYKHFLLSLWCSIGHRRLLGKMRTLFKVSVQCTEELQADLNNSNGWLACRLLGYRHLPTGLVGKDNISNIPSHQPHSSHLSSYTYSSQAAC